MWRNIQNIIRFGFAHSGNDMGPGSLAMFCPSCPQPGINLPENWNEDPEQYVPITYLSGIQTQNLSACEVEVYEGVCLRRELFCGAAQNETT